MTEEMCFSRGSVPDWAISRAIRKVETSFGAYSGIVILESGYASGNQVPSILMVAIQIPVHGSFRIELFAYPGDYFWL